MPAPTPLPGPALRRRTAFGIVLGTGAAGALAGCTGGVDLRPKPGAAAASVSPAVDPDVTLAAQVLDAERGLLEQLHAAVTTHPQLASRLAATTGVHQQHVHLLRHAVPRSARAALASAPPSAGPTDAGPSTDASGSPSAAGPSSPGEQGSAGPRATLATLAAAEDTLSTTAKRAAFRARSGAFARVLASMAAAAAQQANLLRGAGQPAAR